MSYGLEKSHMLDFYAHWMQGEHIKQNQMTEKVLFKSSQIYFCELLKSESKLYCYDGLLDRRR